MNDENAEPNPIVEAVQVGNPLPQLAWPASTVTDGSPLPSPLRRNRFAHGAKSQWTWRDKLRAQTWRQC